MISVVVEVWIGRILVAIAATVLLFDLITRPNSDVSNFTQAIIAFSLTFMALSLFSRILGFRDYPGTGRNMSTKGKSVGFWIQTIAIAVQAVAVSGALLFGFRELQEARSAYQASTVNDVSTRSAELQWRVLNDPELAPLLIGNDQLTPQMKRDLASGLIINHFAMIFDLWKLGGIPAETWEGFSTDIEYTMKTPAFVNRWNEVRLQHGVQFRSYIDEISGWNGE